MSATIQHVQTLYYGNSPDRMPSISDVGRSLIAFEGLLKSTGRALDKMFPEAGLTSVEVAFVSVETGSIIERVLVRFAFGDEKKLMAAVDRLRNHKRIRPLLESPSFVATVTAAVVTAAAVAYLSSCSGGERVHIEGIHNSVIMIGAQEAGIEPDEFRRIVQEVIQEDKSVPANVSKLVAPARVDPDASLRFNDETRLTLKPEAILEIPRTMGKARAEEVVQRHEGVTIELRATDLDKRNGWAARVRTLSPRRARLNIGQINPSRLAGVQAMQGDIVATFIRGDDGVIIPTEYKLIALHSTDRENEESGPKDLFSSMEAPPPAE